MKRSHEILWLLLGAALLFLGHFRWPVHVLAWVAPIPWLLVLRARVTSERGAPLRFRLWLTAISAVAGTLAMMKIVTPPIPPMIAVAFGVPFGVLYLVPFLLWDRLIARGKEGLAVLSFGAAAAVIDWGQAALTPLGVWSAAANTQVDNLPLLQMVSLTGLAGPSFLMAVTAAAFESGWAHRSSVRGWRSFAIAMAAVLAVHTWGAIRIATPLEGPMVRAAAMGTDATFAGLPLPTEEERARVDDALFAHTAEAARAGAQLVVWNEAATLTTKEDEPALRARIQEAARANQVELVAAYIVPLTLSPLLYENKYLWAAPTGELRHEHFKHEPVPGEPAVRGTAPLASVDTAFGKAGGAICYDYDFPYIGLAHARLGVDVVALPSSDWLGIDPLHTQMAAIRAIEGGYSVVRSTRFGLSAGIDSRGRLRGWLSANETSERVLMLSLPARRVPTLYTELGDWSVAPYLVIVVMGLAGLARRRSANMPVANIDVGPASLGDSRA